METLQVSPEPTPTNAIDINMPDGTSFQIHAPGAPDVLKTPKFEVLTEVGAPLEPLTTAETDVSPIIDNPDYSAEPTSSIDHLDFDIDPAEVEPEHVVLYSGISLSGLGDVLRRRKARRSRMTAEDMSVQADQVAEEILDEVDVLDHRRKDAISRQGSRAIPILADVPKYEWEFKPDGTPKLDSNGEPVIKRDSGGNPIRLKVDSDTDLDAYGISVAAEESIATQNYKRSIADFQKTHTTRRLFMDERGDPITEKEYNRRRKVKRRIEHLKNEVSEIESQHEKGLITKRSKALLKQYQRSLEGLSAAEAVTRANPENRKRPESHWQTLTPEQKRARDYSHLANPEKHKAELKNSKISHELSKVMTKIITLKELYGLTGEGGEVPAHMPQSAIDELNELEAHRQHLAHEMAERRAGTDEDSEQQRRKIKKAAEKQQRLRDRADVETVRAAERTWRASAADLSADEIIDLADAEDAARDRIAAKGRRGRRRRR